jgi:hypothetical protein
VAKGIKKSPPPLSKWPDISPADSGWYLAVPAQLQDKLGRGHSDHRWWRVRHCSGMSSANKWRIGDDYLEKSWEINTFSTSHHSLFIFFKILIRIFKCCVIFSWKNNFVGSASKP